VLLCKNDKAFCHQEELEGASLALCEHDTEEVELDGLKRPMVFESDHEK
jgi:hypothetical protein